MPEVDFGCGKGWNASKCGQAGKTCQSQPPARVPRKGTPIFLPGIAATHVLSGGGKESPIVACLATMTSTANRSARISAGLIPGAVTCRPATAVLPMSDQGGEG